MTRNSAFAGWLGLSAAVIGLDHYTKHLVTTLLDHGQVLPVMPAFELRLAHNAGAAFSLLHDAGGWQRWLFSGLAIAVSVALIGWLYQSAGRQRRLPAALALILGGALGNLWDRITLGYVVDFLQVYIGSYPFPTFNVADSAITIGGVLLVLDTLWTRRAETGIEPPNIGQ